MRPTATEEAAVLAAVAYAGVFDYPLTLAQLRATLAVPADEGALARWLDESPALSAALVHHAGFVYAAYRPELPGLRRRREVATLPRLRADRPIIAFIAALPFVRMVALSGSLAHLNADDADPTADLDLFVVTAPGRVWLVTVVALVVAKLRGWRRRLCLNYVVSEAALAVTPHDVFTANQILHLRPVSGHAIYARFVAANPFVRACYPNFAPPASAPADLQALTSRTRRLVEALLHPVAPVMERLCRGLYRGHLLRRASSWASADGVRLEAETLKLHTHSHRRRVLARYDAARAELRRRAEAHAGRLARRRHAV